MSTRSASDNRRPAATRRGALGLALAGVASGGARAGADAKPPEASGLRAVIERYAAAWAAGDQAKIVACYHPEVTLHYFGANALAGDHVGKAAALATLADFGRRTQRKLIGVVATLAGAERGAVIARERLGLGAAAVEVERVLVYAVRDGLLHQCWVYDADQRLIDRLVGPV